MNPWLAWKSRLSRRTSAWRSLTDALRARHPDGGPTPHTPVRGLSRASACRNPRALACVLLGLLVLVGAAPVAVHAQGTQSGTPPASPPAGGNAVPVSATLVVRKDVALWLRGLGAVQALQSVQLRSRVDGTLMRVPVAEGQEVKQGDLLAVIDPRPYQALLDAALAKKRQDEAQLAAARSDLARYASLAASEIASKQKLELTQALVGQITASIAADEAQIDAAKLNLAFCYITAPFDGRVGLRTVDPGNFVRAAEVTSVMPLAQIRPIAVTFTVPQDQLPAVQRAMASGKPRVVAYASDDRTELDQGQLLTLDNSIDAATGTIKLKAVFPNDGQRLWPGQFVNARLLVATTVGALTVPSAAVRHAQEGLFVFVIKPDQTVSRQTVELARDDGVTAVVSKGVEEGQQVVTDGHSRLQNGTKVAILPVPAASPAAAATPSSGAAVTPSAAATPSPGTAALPSPGAAAPRQAAEQRPKPGG